jgi:predicted SAM-dependent methyltransferase
MRKRHPEMNIQNRDGKNIWLNLACGGNRLPAPWENYDREMDLRRSLPFQDGAVSRIVLEHGLEHLDSREAWCFLEEVHRVLCDSGVIRITVPSIFKASECMTEAHRELLRRHKWGDGSTYSALRAIACEHWHKTLWTQDLLGKVLETIGFKWVEMEKNKSDHPELVDIDWHWKHIGKEADIEGIVVEATKIQISRI